MVEACIKELDASLAGSNEKLQKRELELKKAKDIIIDNTTIIKVV